MLIHYAGSAHWQTVAVAAASLAIILLWPRLTRRIPGSIVALLLSRAVVAVFHLPIETIGSKFGGIPQGFPHFTWPGFHAAHILPLLPSAFTVALLAAVESLLSAVVADGMSGDHHNSNVELVAQGVANIVSPLFGGIPATGAIARTATNIRSGALTPVAGMVHALTLLAILLVAAPLARFVPLATLAAVLFVVAYNMGEWKEIGSILRLSRTDIAVWLTTFTVISFLHLLEEPKRIAMIGLGGGSMAKWCYHHLLATDITVIEINPMVIALRDQFHIPADDHRFRVICGDGADYVASTEDSPQVLLVDGFDVHGQPPQLCSQAFYEDCYRALAPDGLMVVNLCGPEEQRAMDRIRRTFEDRVLVIIPEDGENKVVFAGKGRPLWVEEQPADHLEKSLRANDALTPSLLQQSGRP